MNMSGVNHIIVKLLAALFIVAAGGYILFGEYGLSEALITFFQNLLNYTI